MAIKAGQIIHTGDTVLVQRLQSGGPGSLNIPTNKITELGNYQAVAVTRDTPDLSFSMESFDSTTALEKLLTKGGSSGPYTISSPQPIDIASQWLAGQGNIAGLDQFSVVEGVALPQLAVESVQYRFGVTDNAAKTVTLRGDSIFYCPGPVVVESFTGAGTAGQACLLTNPAGVYNGDTLIGPRRALNVSVNGNRLIPLVDYTETTTGSGAFLTTTVHLTAAAVVGAKVQIVYFTNAAVTFPQSVHTDPSVKPAAIRGRDITVLVNGVAATNRWTGVQSVSVEERFTIERDQELGNPYAVAVDYTDVPTVSGSITVRSRSPQDFHAKLIQASGVSSATEAIGAGSSVPVRLDVVLHHPDTGAVLETLEMTDARLSVPGYSGRVNTKLDVQIDFQSDSGFLSALDVAPA